VAHAELHRQARKGTTALPVEHDEARAACDVVGQQDLGGVGLAGVRPADDRRMGSEGRQSDVAAVSVVPEAHDILVDAPPESLRPTTKDDDRADRRGGATLRAAAVEAIGAAAPKHEPGSDERRDPRPHGPADRCDHSTIERAV
jgi:hypothetical protein